MYECDWLTFLKFFRSLDIPLYCFKNGYITFIDKINKWTQELIQYDPAGSRILVDKRADS